MSESEPIVVRSARSPYIVFIVILGPVFVLGMYAATRPWAQTNVFFLPAVPVFIVSLTSCYLYRLRLVLSDRRLIYRAMWRETEVAIDEIQAIEAVRPYGFGRAWIIRPVHHAPPLVANVGNFDPGALQDPAKALHARAPGIRFSRVRL